MDIDVVEYKDVYFKIRSTEDLFAQLEDNAVALSTMKASRFFVTFEKPITHWEKTLSNMSEIIELALSVQRQWMYLESIFMASEDIRKQLPAESVLFDNVNKEQGRIFTRMHGGGQRGGGHRLQGAAGGPDGDGRGARQDPEEPRPVPETKRQMFSRGSTF